jgi:GNAT superfamily N-acetyltransferase
MVDALPPPRLYDPATDTHFLDQIARLQAHCILVDGQNMTFVPPLSHDKILASWQQWSRDVEQGNRVIVLQLSLDEQEVAGVVALVWSSGETSAHRAEVGRLIVSPNFRKQGVARRVMGVLEQEARARGRWMIVSFPISCPCSGHANLGCQTLDTALGTGAEHVYPRLGYTEVGRIPGYGIHPVDQSPVTEVWYYKDLR